MLHRAWLPSSRSFQLETLKRGRTALRRMRDRRGGVQAGKPVRRQSPQPVIRPRAKRFLIGTGGSNPLSMSTCRSIFHRMRLLTRSIRSSRAWLNISMAVSSGSAGDNYRRGLAAAKAIADDARAIGLAGPLPSLSSSGIDPPTFDQIVDDDELHQTSRKLFLDGYYALAVEEAYKCLNNIVKDLTGLKNLDGVPLMQKALSPKNPLLKLNDLRTQSEKDQQRGYMEMFAAAITGIRNPRAHEHGYLDDPETALELMGLANHLVRIARSAASRTRG